MSDTSSTSPVTPPKPFGLVARSLAAMVVIACMSIGLWPQQSDAPLAPRVKKAKRMLAFKAPRTLAKPLPPVPEFLASEPLAPEAETGELIATGQASYYGQELAGNRTASGERFDPSDLTAAHRTLPLGSRVRVVNERTGESVIVRVNDRGPFTRDRVLDVSEQAAREISMLRGGTARVRVELLPRRRG